MGKKIECVLNGVYVGTELSPGLPTLDFIRHHLRLTGTKEGCKEGECGACTVLVGELQGEFILYKAVASCLLPLGEIHGKHIVTVEGLNCSSLNPVQQAIVDEGASQCGFCTPGIVMSLTGFLLTGSSLDSKEAIDALDGNICRCTGYAPIRRAAWKLAETYAPLLDNSRDRVEQLVEWSILPAYFLNVREMLGSIKKALNVETENAVFIAGATDLLVQKPAELAEKNENDLVFISRHPGLSGIQMTDDGIVIGAGTSVEDMKNSAVIGKVFPKMYENLKLVSSTLMRNRATLAGNIVNASPIGDLSILLLSLDANLSLFLNGSRRSFPLKEFYKGYKITELRKGEIIESISIRQPVVGTDWRYNFEKVSQRKILDIASCNSAISVLMGGNIITEVHISAGGVAPFPLYMKKTSEFLQGKNLTGELVIDAVEVMGSDISPISDIRGSAAYKSKLLRNLFFAHFIMLFPEYGMEEKLLPVLSEGGAQ